MLETDIHLFKVITTRDEITIGLTTRDLAALGGSDAAIIGRRLVADGTLDAWQYAVRRGRDGLEQGPLRRVSILAHDSLRIEPYGAPMPVVSYEPVEA